MRVEFVVGSFPCSERFFSRYFYSFPSPQKPTLSNSNSIRNAGTCLNAFLRTPTCFNHGQTNYNNIFTINNFFTKHVHQCSFTYLGSGVFARKSEISLVKQSRSRKEANRKFICRAEQKAVTTHHFHFNDRTSTSITSWHVLTFDFVVICTAFGMRAEVSTFSTKEISLIGMTTDNNCRILKKIYENMLILITISYYPRRQLFWWRGHHSRSFVSSPLAAMLHSSSAKTLLELTIPAALCSY